MEIYPVRQNYVHLRPFSLHFFVFTTSYYYCFLGVYNAMKLIGCTLVNFCCYCWVLSAAEHTNAACSSVSRPTPHRIFLLRSLCSFSSMSCVTGLRRGGRGGEGERVNERKGIPLPFFPDPLPLSTQATTPWMPGLRHTFWFYSFVPWVQREYRARLEISYIEFFFQRS